MSAPPITTQQVASLYRCRESKLWRQWARRSRRRYLTADLDGLDATGRLEREHEFAARALSTTAKVAMVADTAMRMPMTGDQSAST
jgi:hypothetical protein